MRWERLFDDLEGQAAHEQRETTEAMAADLRDDAWQQTTWRSLLGGRCVLDVRGAGRVEGEVVLVNEHLVRLVDDRVVATRHVVAVPEAERRADPPGRFDDAVGWPSVLRALRDAGEQVRLTLDDGRTLEGAIDVVGRDFVRLRGGRTFVLDAVVLLAPA